MTRPREGLARVRVTARIVLPAACAALLVLAQICYPLTSGTGRDRVTVVVVLLSATTALAHATATRGLRFALGFAVIVTGLGLLAEIVGTATGLPFGCYAYAVDRLGPALHGVPLIVALAWTGGLYPVWVVAGLLTRGAQARIALTALGAVGWDLFLDPQMVADGQWSWCDTDAGPPGLAHIPYTNYLGWFAVALVMGALLSVWARVAPGSSARLDDTPSRSADVDALVPVAVFLWTWLGSALAHAVFLGLPYSALYGGVGLGLLGVPLLLRYRPRPENRGIRAARPAR
ncbi:carotenoid biosynthesis protein [Nocardia brasiliensis]|uniref:Carotenoid biosynthesis protein n=1 Tax=Nocardia brasiliensis TaxID=37326 RepID=A0A6G9XPF4_NOCBR|nr:carotenoid biosynthesis protein [Nocardia brasiliensis]QIS02832.1 carotenoid biosynthesis protein [Nocardia brasiliensis]